MTAPNETTFTEDEPVLATVGTGLIVAQAAIIAVLAFVTLTPPQMAALGVAVHLAAGAGIVAVLRGRVVPLVSAVRQMSAANITCDDPGWDRLLADVMAHDADDVARAKASHPSRQPAAEGTE